MAKNPSGSIVSRAAATGGGRRRRGSAKISNFSLAMILIVVLGVLSIVWARSDYQSRASSAAAKVPPVVGQSPAWTAGVVTNICGRMAPNFTASTSSQTGGLRAEGNGVVTISPTSSSESGRNATLSAFLSDWSTNKATASTYILTSRSLTMGSTTFTNGEACPKGTPLAGQKGEVRIGVWPNYAAYVTNASPTVTTEATLARFAQNHTFMTVYFGPSTARIPRPSAGVAASVIQGSSTTTTTTPSTTTSVAITTTSMASTTTTTKK